MTSVALHKKVVVSVAPTPTDAALGPVAFTSTGDKFIFTPAKPVDIYRYGFVTNALLDVGVTFILALDWRPTAGSDTNRAEKATITTGTTDQAAGKMGYRDIILPVAAATAGDGSTVNVGPDGPLEVDPGEEVVIEVTNAADTAGTGYVWIEYVEHDIGGSRTALAVEYTS